MFQYLDKNKIYKMSFTKGITWNPLSWLGGAIRQIANIEYNHTGVLYFMEGKWKLQEAIGDGVVSKPFYDSNAYAYYTEWTIEEASFEYSYIRAISRISSIEGKKYDYKGLLFYQFYLNVFDKWLGRAVKDGDKYYCYETVQYIFDIEERKPKDINSKFITIYKNK
jgi:hypothetical protein